MHISHARKVALSAVVCTILSIGSFATAAPYDDDDVSPRSGKTKPAAVVEPAPETSREEMPATPNYTARDEDAASHKGASKRYVGQPQRGEFHIDVGFSFFSGGSELDDAIDEVYKVNFISGETTKVDVGPRVDLYYEFANGVGVGGGVGPILFRNIQDKTGFSSAPGEATFVVIPVGLDIRYTFFRDRAVAPYLRGGFRYPIVAGDLVEGGSVGPFGAVGVDFLRNKAVGFGVEASYDGSEIDVQLGNVKRSAKPMQFMLSVFVEF